MKTCGWKSRTRSKKKNRELSTQMSGLTPDFLMSNDCVCAPVIAHFSLLILRFFTESWGKEQLGGASADAQSYWQGRFAACAFVGGFLGIGRPRNSWGVAPNPSRDAVPAPCKGQLPLDPFFVARLGRFSLPLGLSGFFISPAHAPEQPHKSPNPHRPHSRSRADDPSGNSASVRHGQSLPHHPS